MTARQIAYAQLLVVAVLFGGTWPAGKVAVDHAPPLTVAFVRFVLSSILLWAWSRYRGRAVPFPRRADWPLVAALGISGIAVYNAFFLFGLQRTPATDGSILVPGLIPVMTTLLAWRVFGQRPTRAVALGFAIAIVGLLVVVDPSGSESTHRLVGDLILVGASVCWAVYTILGRAATTRFDSTLATTYAAIAGALILLPFSILGWGKLAHAPAVTWLAIAYLAPLGTVVAFVLFYEGVRKIGSAKAAAFTLLVPVFGVTSSVIVLGEPLRWQIAVGGAIVLLGLWFVQRQPRAQAAAPVPAAQEAQSRA
ncbi:MAG TPA: DMT family transporter [Gaiellaceae bacterium]|nr:DMT family transporter [Gaiellaceae bacterium]